MKRRHPGNSQSRVHSKLDPCPIAGRRAGLRRARMTVLITAGPTREWMDPVRFISNPSSGVMGLTLADVLSKRGMKVTLILGPTHRRPSKKIRAIHVETALDMEKAVKQHLKKTDVFIATAAVSDWRPAHISPQKLKKSHKNTMTVKLVKNPDILSMAGKYKNLLLIGFALETDQILKHAKEKLRAKNLDLIVANRPGSFGSERIQPTLIDRNGSVEKFPAMTKKTLSVKLAKWIGEKWNKTN